MAILLRKRCLFPPRRVPTPFGEVGLPNLCLPTVGFPTLDDRKGRALGHALGSDLSLVAGFIPLVGDLVADVLEDLHMAELKKALSPEEYERFLEHTKVGPDTLAVIETFLEGEG